MNNAAKFLKFAAIFALFVMALSAAVELTQTNKLTADKTDDMIYGTDWNLIQVPKIMGEFTVSGPEVLQSIFHIQEIGADIQVDGYYFSKGLIIDQTNVSMIDLTGNYAATYVRNTDGTLNQVVFNIR